MQNDTEVTYFENKCGSCDNVIFKSVSNVNNH